MIRGMFLKMVLWFWASLVLVAVLSAERRA